MKSTEHINHTPDLPSSIYPPLNYSYWWAVVAILVALLIIGTYFIIFVWTLPYSTLLRYSLTRTIATRNVKRKFLRSLDKLDKKINHQKIDLRSAHTQLDKLLRNYLELETSLPLRKMTLDRIEKSSLSFYSDSFAISYDGKYSYDSDTGILGNLNYIRELISTWEH